MPALLVLPDRARPRVPVLRARATTRSRPAKAWAVPLAKAPARAIIPSLPAKVCRVRRLVRVKPVRPDRGLLRLVPADLAPAVLAPTRA